MTGRFALFADCLLVGCLTAVAALPVVTAYPALVAACAALREQVAEDRAVGPRRYLALLGQVVRSGPAGLLAPPLVAAVLALDALAIASGVPGRVPLTVLLILAGSAAAVLGLRIAARWRPGARWPDLARAAASTRDPRGSVLLLLAATAAVAIALAVPITLLLVTGPLALAAIAVDQRQRAAPTTPGGRPRRHHIRW
jgi:hypothetical protein